jgi:Glyoxalase-like domain
MPTSTATTMTSRGGIGGIEFDLAGNPVAAQAAGTYGYPVYSVIKTVTFDCADALVTAGFWAAVLGSNVDENSTSDKAFVEAAGWGGPNMWFNRVPEPKAAKNRIHLDLRAPGSVADEVTRLTALGATVLEVGEDLIVMADPEGNEFCVE